MINYFKSSSSKRKENLKLKKEDKKNDDRERQLQQDLKVLQIKKSKVLEAAQMLEENISYIKRKITKKWFWWKKLKFPLLFSILNLSHFSNLKCWIFVISHLKYLLQKYYS